MSPKIRKVPFEVALTMTGFGKFNILLLILCGGLIMAMVFESLSVSYLVPASACDLGTTNYQQGLMASTPLIGIIATSQIWGYLADTRGRKKIITLGLMLGFITGAMATFSPNWIMFCAFKLFSSSAVSGVFSLSFTLLSECTPAAKRNIMVVLATSIFMLSTGFMAVLAIPTLSLRFSYYIPILNINFNAWRLLNIIYCAPCALTLFGVLFVYESPKFLVSIGKEEESLEILRAFYVINSGKSAEDYQVIGVTLSEEGAVPVTGLWASVMSQTLPLVKPPLLKKTLLLAALYCIIYFCINPYVVWLPYMADRFMRSLESGEDGLTFCQMLRTTENTTTTEVGDCSMNPVAMTIIFSIIVLLSILNALMSTFMACCGRKRLLIGIQLVTGSAALMVNVSAVWLLSAILFFVFISGFLNFGILTTYSVDVFPTYLKASAVCLTLMIGRGTSVLGVNLLKAMLVNNCEESFYFFGTLTICGGLIALLLPSDKKKVKEEIIS